VHAIYYVSITINSNCLLTYSDENTAK